MLDNVGCQNSPSQNHPQIFSLSLVWAQAFCQNIFKSFSDDSKVQPGLGITARSCSCSCMFYTLDGNSRCKTIFAQKQAHVSLLSHSFIQKTLSDYSVQVTMAATENATVNKSDTASAFMEFAF